MSLEKNIEEVISPSLERMSYNVVDVKIIGDGVKKILQILIENESLQDVSVKDCENASFQISALLDVEFGDFDNFTLEVSSAGIDRPLTKLRDYERFKGREVKIELYDKVNESKKVRGEIIEVNYSLITIKSNVSKINSGDEEKITTDFDNIKKARLVIDEKTLFKKTKQTKG